MSKNAITIVHAIVGMRGMHKLCVLFGTQMLDAHSSIVNATSSVNTEVM